MTHPTILQQIDLMKQALKCQSDIETLTRLIKPVDEPTYKVMCAETQQNYIHIMSELFSNLLITSYIIQQ